MLTGRGGAFLIVVLALWAFGLIAGIAAVALVGTALLLWFFLSWVVFVVRVRLAFRRLRLERATDADSAK